MTSLSAVGDGQSSQARGQSVLANGDIAPGHRPLSEQPKWKPGLNKWANVAWRSKASGDPDCSGA